MDGTIETAGERRAFARLFEQHHGAIRQHCYRMLGSLSEAEDVTQDTFLRAWHHLPAFAGRASLRTWLYRIATNAALDALSYRAIRLPPIHGPDAEEAASDELDPAAIIESREMLGLAFVSLIQAMPARQRAVLILREVLHWSADEVADLLQTTVPAVNSALQRARGAAGLARRPEAIATHRAAQSAELQHTVASYIRAWEAADAGSLVALLKDDATL